MFLIDTHAHVNFNAYKSDSDEVIRRALDNGIWMINVGSQFKTSDRAVKIACAYGKGVYAAVGLHPIHLFDFAVEEEDSFNAKKEKFDDKKYQALIDFSKKVVAVGEIGFDYYHLSGKIERKEAKKIQRREFIKQLEFARANDLPVILHSRGTKDQPLCADNDLLDVLNGYRGQIRGVKHCFTADTETALKFIDLGFYIGFTGIITFGKNADALREVVKNIPLNKILVETDCPYLAPDPRRGERNEPSYVEYIAKRVAEIKQMTFNETTQILIQNSKKLFRIQQKS
ncbi:hydrolase TatD [Candidatus Kuenenbacteria bacterium CG11_big_fil_rev_8_21_14_0_20_37_9]|nr:MAG: hydrolase TatD [Candidatus Kuenenbacteria bacterium CG11_big_fil_rev_8_21_14_0_20_37_9]